MIQALVFDLDGTLLDTEPLKNSAYVRVALELSPASVTAAEVIAVATQLVGLPAPETAMELVRRLSLEGPARARMSELQVAAPWQAFLRLHAAAYCRLLDEPGVLQHLQFPHAVSLLHQLRGRGYSTALATMSYRPEVLRILSVLGWADAFDVVVTGDEVALGKPNPEVYLRAAQRLAVRPDECLAIEDSSPGIAGALAAGMSCVAVPTELTREAVRETRLDERWIVDEPATLRTVVERILAGSVEGRE